MKAGAALTKERTLALYARIGEESIPLRLKFTDENGDPFDITDLDFELIVKRAPNAKNDLFTLSIGDGLTVQGSDSDQLEITVSNARALGRLAESNFYQLRSVTEDHTWLSGLFKWHNGDFDGGQRTITRIGLTWRNDMWVSGTSRHWNLDRSDPR